MGIGINEQLAGGGAVLGIAQSKIVFKLTQLITTIVIRSFRAVLDHDFSTSLTNETLSLYIKKTKNKKKRPSHSNGQQAQKLFCPFVGPDLRCISYRCQLSETPPERNDNRTGSQTVTT